MKLLQVTVLCLLTSVGSSEDHQAETSTSTVLRSTISTAKTSGPTPVTMTAPNLVMQSTAGTSPKGITNKEFLQTSPLPALASLITTVKGEEATTNDVKKKELTTKSATVTDLPLPNDVSTLQSSQNKTENQSSVNTTERLVSTSQPDASPSKTSILLSISTATAENISQSQGTESAKNASPSSASSSHSSIILPVVIALIVITLSVFALVGLYRLCRKTDPGTAENGNDQPQSDKESVKLLTVKTISHESGERSAQGKTKN
ncbi:endomucin isoform X2 [Eptesicus fuscus]|uniref:endomucin isoform X2 n=1 Tax=Eptesicus fuscus TaxID=29078 RepID=UPI0024044A70|nr:endomucin isoform X2 [Eptesicus fuscus]XP_054583022.1 endomucin isoform X2 [Eptesicus fuscus]